MTPFEELLLNHIESALRFYDIPPLSRSECSVLLSEVLDYRGVTSTDKRVFALAQSEGRGVDGVLASRVERAVQEVMTCAAERAGMTPPPRTLHVEVLQEDDAFGGEGTVEGTLEQTLAEPPKAGGFEQSIVIARGAAYSDARDLQEYTEETLSTDRLRFPSKEDDTIDVDAPNGAVQVIPSDMVGGLEEQLTAIPGLEPTVIADAPGDQSDETAELDPFDITNLTAGFDPSAEEFDATVPEEPPTRPKPSRRSDRTKATAGRTSRKPARKPTPAKKSGKESGKGRALGQYTLLKELSRGGNGIVYEGVQTDLRVPVAVKLLRKGRISAHDRESFKAEALRVTELKHPNIVDWKNYGEDEHGTPYFVMELLKGKDLEDLLDDERRLEPDRVVALLLQILEALRHAHHRKGKEAILHLDLKPKNVFILDSVATGENERAKVIDFGISKYLGGETSEDGPDDESAAFPGDAHSGGSVLSAQATGTAGGSVQRYMACTPNYASPEQAAHYLGVEPIPELDARSDIYSLGTMAFKMLTGELPFRSKPAASARQRRTRLLREKLERDAPPVSIGGAKIPKPLAAFVDKCMKRDPEERFQTTQEAYDALHRIAHPPVWKTVAAVTIPAVLIVGIVVYLMNFQEVQLNAWRPGQTSDLPRLVLGDKPQRLDASRVGDDYRFVDDKGDPIDDFELVVGELDSEHGSRQLTVNLTDVSAETHRIWKSVRLAEWQDGAAVGEPSENDFDIEYIGSNSWALDELRVGGDLPVEDGWWMRSSAQLSLHLSGQAIGEGALKQVQVTSESGEPAIERTIHDGPIELPSLKELITANGEPTTLTFRVVDRADNEDTIRRVIHFEDAGFAWRKRPELAHSETDNVYKSIETYTVRNYFTVQLGLESTLPLASARYRLVDKLKGESDSEFELVPWQTLAVSANGATGEVSIAPAEGYDEVGLEVHVTSRVRNSDGLHLEESETLTLVAAKPIRVLVRAEGPDTLDKSDCDLKLETHQAPQSLGFTREGGLELLFRLPKGALSHAKVKVSVNGAQQSKDVEVRQNEEPRSVTLERGRNSIKLEVFSESEDRQYHKRFERTLTVNYLDPSAMPGVRVSIDGGPIPSVISQGLLDRGAIVSIEKAAWEWSEEQTFEIRSQNAGGPSAEETASEGVSLSDLIGPRWPDGRYVVNGRTKDQAGSPKSHSGEFELSRFGPELKDLFSPDDAVWNSVPGEGSQTWKLNFTLTDPNGIKSIGHTVTLREKETKEVRVADLNLALDDVFRRERGEERWLLQSELRVVECVATISGFPQEWEGQEIEVLVEAADKHGCETPQEAIHTVRLGAVHWEPPRRILHNGVSMIYVAPNTIPFVFGGDQADFGRLRNVYGKRFQKSPKKNPRKYRVGEIAGFYLDEHESNVGGVPKTGVSLQDARKAADSRRVRLPTAVEWQFAVRGKKNSRLFSIADEKKWRTSINVGSGKLQAVTVGSDVSEEGFHHLCGNVAEWVSEGWAMGGSARPGSRWCDFREVTDAPSDLDWVGFRCAISASEVRRLMSENNSRVVVP